jgi:hypothetical protein
MWQALSTAKPPNLISMWCQFPRQQLHARTLGKRHALRRSGTISRLQLPFFFPFSLAYSPFWTDFCFFSLSHSVLALFIAASEITVLSYHRQPFIDLFFYTC